ncbi:hypothetical protein V1460_23590 [Streptomyces sp. SCSIO 30461]|uniref:hypothetical protein n=1 Tax=Streptomyces sp. SCSIO 30461 TaxID=3118085 RepID=UPI0030CF277D
MPPPPPPLGRARRRGARIGPAFDPALGDLELSSTRTKLSQGRWAAARSLLVSTGDDWDRRGHRLLVLGGGPSTAAWAREWLLVEPDSPDATALLACASVRAALRGAQHPDQARSHCLAAAGLAPEDPSPWLALLVLARSLGTDGEVVRLFDEVRVRHPEHHHAHHLMAARLAERHPEAGQDPLHEVYDFAAWAAERAPADSPLAMLPVVAHTERYRVLAADSRAFADPPAAGHWTGRRARQVMKTAFDWWLEWEREDHPRNRVDLNFLAHAKFREGRAAEAAALFHRIGSHATPAPWSYPDQDPHHAFHAARRAALGAV